MRELYQHLTEKKSDFSVKLTGPRNNKLRQNILHIRHASYSEFPLCF